MQNPTTQCQKRNYTVQANTACQNIYSTNSEFEGNCKLLLQEQFTKPGYDSFSIETEIKKIKFLERKDLLTPKTT